MSTISAVLIVKDEEKKLEVCLKALKWADEIVILDSGSKDHTVDIARHYTPRVYHRPFDTFANQKNYAIDQATGEWILSIDADEIVTPELARSLREIAEKGSPLNGFYLNRQNILFGKQLRFAGQTNEKLIRFFRKGKGKFEQPIHEKIVVEGNAGELAGDLLHYSTPTVAVYMEKLNFYTGQEAKWMFQKGIKPDLQHLYINPFLRFIYFYFLRLGFMDGWEGLLYHSLSSFYYFLKYAKLKEYWIQSCEKNRH